MLIEHEIEQDIWNEHTAWSVLADRLKQARTRARVAVLLLTVAGAILQTIAGTYKSVEVGKLAGGAGTVALALVPMIAGVWLKPDRTKKWLRARSISEGIKSEFHLYRAQAEPYNGAEALPALVNKTQQIRSWGSDMNDLRARVMPTGKPFPDIHPESYVGKRVQKQIDEYYTRKAKINADLAQAFRWVEILLTFVTAIVSALATYMTSEAAKGATVAFPLAAWVAVLTTIAGTVAAFAAVGRYDFQATTYFATAANLKDLIQSWSLSKRPSSPSSEWSKFVKECESTISAENRDWMAKLDDGSATNATSVPVTPAPKQGPTTGQP